MTETPRNAAVVTHCTGNMDKQLTWNKNWLRDTLNNSAWSFAHWQHGEKEQIIVQHLTIVKQTTPKLSALNHHTFGAGNNLVVVPLVDYGLSNVVAVHKRVHQGEIICSSHSLVWGLVLAGPLPARDFWSPSFPVQTSSWGSSMSPEGKGWGYKASWEQASKLASSHSTSWWESQESTGYFIPALLRYVTHDIV